MSAPVVNSHLADDLTIWQPGFQTTSTTVVSVKSFP